jgi:hypothetical protein
MWAWRSRACPADRRGRVTEPVLVGEALPGVLAEVVDRAGHGYDRWIKLVAQAGYCHHPIRLAGRVDQADRQTGEIRQVYDSEREPDGCCSRRAALAASRVARPALRPTGLTPTSSWPQASRVARASLRRWQPIRGCS